MGGTPGGFLSRADEGERGFGGWGGIRTHEELAPLPVFKTGAFNHSATHPGVVAASSYQEPPGQGRGVWPAVPGCPGDKIEWTPPRGTDKPRAA